MVAEASGLSRAILVHDRIPDLTPPPNNFLNFETIVAATRDSTSLPTRHHGYAEKDSQICGGQASHRTKGCPTVSLATADNIRVPAHMYAGSRIRLRRSSRRRKSRRRKMERWSNARSPRSPQTCSSSTTPPWSLHTRSLSIPISSVTRCRTSSICSPP